MKKVQYERSAPWKEHNTKKLQHEMSAAQDEKRAIEKRCNIEIVKHEQITTRKRGT